MSSVSYLSVSSQVIVSLREIGLHDEYIWQQSLLARTGVFHRTDRKFWQKYLNIFSEDLLYPTSGHQEMIAGTARKILAKRAISLARDIRIDVGTVASAMIVTSRRFPRDLRRTRPPWLWRHVSPPAILRRTWRVAHNASREVRACFFIFFSAYQFDHSRTAKCVFLGWSVTPICKRMHCVFRECYSRARLSVGSAESTNGCFNL